MRTSRDEFWFGIAAQYATRATCPRASIGAVLVKFDRIVGAGFNGAAPGLPHCLERNQTREQHMALDHCGWSVHAERNAVYNTFIQVDGATLYVVGPRPVCPSCRDYLESRGVTDIRHRSSADPLTELLAEVVAWQRETFSGERLVSAAVHLMRELAEMQADPTSEEHADVLMLATCVIDRATQIRNAVLVSAADLGIDMVAETARKLAVNRQRTWGPADADGVIEHIRDEGARSHAG